MEIQRNLFKEVLAHHEKKEITLITGPRQSGKTTLMKAVEAVLQKNGRQSMFLTLDYMGHSQYFVSQDTFLQKLNLEFGNKQGTVFIDEIQRITDAGLFLKGIYDLGTPYKFIVSGSGSLELKEHIHESLAGRKLTFELFPVSFDEFVRYKTAYKYSNRMQEFYETEVKQTDLLLKDYMEYGGYPRVITAASNEDKMKEINEIYQSYLERDIIGLLRLSNPGAFSKLIRILATVSGQFVSLNELASHCSLSVPTVKKYLWYAEKTFVLNPLTPYFTNKLKELVKWPVFYFSDPGFRNFGAGSFGNATALKEAGFVFQNCIYTMLREKCRWKPWTIHYWRTTDKAEVDFIINQGKAVIPVEVKYISLKQPKISRSLRSFIDKYQPPKAYVINLTLKDKIKIGSTLINVIPYHHLIGEDI